MLHGRGHHMPFAWLRRERRMDRRVDALGAATGEQDLFRIRVDQASHLLSSSRDRGSQRMPERVGARRVSPMLAQERQHLFQNLRGNPGGGVVIKIDHRRFIRAIRPGLAWRTEALCGTLRVRAKATFSRTRENRLDAVEN